MDPIRMEKTMPCYVGLDASKKTTHICVLDENGLTVDEGFTTSDPKAIISFLRGKRRRYARVGLEAWSLASWLYTGLAKDGLPVIVIEACHAHGMLAATRRNKTDRNDARGIAELMRRGVYKAVHVKTPGSQDIKAELSVRKLLLTKAHDIENGIQGVLLLHGLKLRPGLNATFERHSMALARPVPKAADLIKPLLAVRRTLLDEVARFDVRLKSLAANDPVCERLMTAPGVGALTALTFRAAIDEPRRFTRSRNVGVHLGLTPRTRQSGEKETRRGISKMGDESARTALFLAAITQMRRSTRPSWLKTWGEQVAARRGRKKAVVAVARKLAVTLHSMWVNETEFRWSAESA
jgi:transposase